MQGCTCALLRFQGRRVAMVLVGSILGLVVLAYAFHA